MKTTREKIELLLSLKNSDDIAYFRGWLKVILIKLGDDVDFIFNKLFGEQKDGADE